MIQTLVSVPPRLDAWLRQTKRPNRPLSRPAVDFVGSDPVGRRLGSGGGTVALLHRAWAEQGRGASLEEWIEGSARLVLHAGGESRRLPAYAAAGKALIPVPPEVDTAGSKYDQVLADLQLGTYQQTLREAGARSRLMVASGDVWLEFDPLGIPAVSADIAGIGMRVSPEVARHFGVFFVRKSTGGAAAVQPKEQPIAFFLQKPSPAQIYRHSAAYDFYVDTGLWLFSAPAVAALFRRCGWKADQQRFETDDGHPAYLDLYTEVGTALGSETTIPSELRELGFGQLTTGVIPLEHARFLHLGSSRQLLETFEQIASPAFQRTRFFSIATPTTNRTGSAPGLPVWVEAAGDLAGISLGGNNVLTGHYPNAGEIHLKPGQCVEIAPVGAEEFVVRPYHIDDPLRGPADGSALICGQPATAWLTRRKLTVSNQDVFHLPLYPVVRARTTLQPILDWFFSDHPPADGFDPTADGRTQRISAADIPDQVDFDRYFDLRDQGFERSLLAQLQEAGTGDLRLFHQDFSAIATLAQRRPALKRWLLERGPSLAKKVTRPEHQARLLMLLSTLTKKAEASAFAERAHVCLQQGVIASEQLPKARPQLSLKEDQIVWGRSPVRLDLAGGWTDTPPYCLEFGGAVLNVAVLLNGQPPIQVFVRPLKEPILSLRSIDLGASEIIKTQAALDTFRDPRSGFSLPKAALAMAGFHRAFSSGRPAPSLQAQLRRFGGGLEISLLSAVPKGSGLGTSSILAATILAALNRACGLGWDAVDLYNRVLGVEQLLTTGGGWQDQAGALFRGLKLVETSPGPAQSPTVRYLPQHLIGPGHANRTLLLYYTGITRLAKGILKEIVQDMFLGRFETLRTLGLIRVNAHTLFGAIQRDDPDTLARCIGRSWDLNKRLDPGTSSAEIEGILRACGNDLRAAKLLGAGGGGYMLLCAQNPDAGERIRTKLEAEPPNQRARFISFEVAEKGLEVTVS